MVVDEVTSPVVDEVTSPVVDEVTSPAHDCLLAIYSQGNDFKLSHFDSRWRLANSFLHGVGDPAITDLAQPFELHLLGRIGRI